MLRRLRGWTSVLALATLVVSALATQAGAQGALRLVILKRQHLLEVVQGDRILRLYRVSLGFSPFGAKQIRGDGKTPVGIYMVYDKRPSDRFRWFLALNYPASQDADRAFNAGLISADTWADIYLAEKRGDRPPFSTALGGLVGIHGTGAGGRKAQLRLISDWTDGCIALADRDIDELYATIPVGTTVEIRE